MKVSKSGSLQHIFRVIPRRLASVKVGSILIIAVFAFTLATAFFPYTEAAGLIRKIGEVLELENLSRTGALSFQERFESPPFLLLVLVLGLSLCFSLYFRIRAELKRRRAEQTWAQQTTSGKRPQGVELAAVEAVARTLERRGYRVQAAGAAGAWNVRGDKGAAGIWGSVIFHVGILLILAAVVLSASASFRASVKLTEGQQFDARADQYGMQKAGRWYSPPSQPLTFRLVRVEPEYEIKGATTVASIVEPTLDGRRSRFLEPAPVRISNGLRHAGVTIHQGRETGYAPLVIVEDAAGKRLLQGYTRLATTVEPQSVSYLDFVEIKDQNIRIELELLPDAAYRDGVYVSRSSALKNPVLHAVVRAQGKSIFDQFIPMTRNVSEGGYTVFFGEVRRWSQLDISDAPGVPVLMAGTLLGTFGLALRLLFVRRRVLVTLSGMAEDRMAAFTVTGASEKFHRLFNEELDAIRAVLADWRATSVDPEPPPAKGVTGRPRVVQS